MKIEDIMKSNRPELNAKPMPQGHEERFRAQLNRHLQAKNKTRKLWILLPAVAASLLVVLAITQLMPEKTTKDENTALVEMRRDYDAKMDAAINDLGTVLLQVDDTTRQQLEKVIDDLRNTSEVFADLAPLPEEKQLALSEQIYDSRLQVIERLVNNIKK